ncbi:MAG: bacterioferritin-associated ferredoxin-like protein [Nitrospinaceae bacterium]|nr:bacterioferritin-associated ferredoxin-like protein [Nitrospinaceae bacterium]
MYVCICNALTEADVSRCLETGAITAADIYKAAGCRPNCGICKDDMESLIREQAPQTVED